MSLRVHEDRQKMESLKREVDATGVFESFPEKPEINMFFTRFTDPALAGKETALASAFERHGVLLGVGSDGWIRFVGHNDVSLEDIKRVGALLGQAVAEVRVGRIQTC